MSDILSSLSISASGMRAYSARLRLTSENLANVDTPGYRRKLTSFQEAAGINSEIGEVIIGRTQLDQAALSKIHDPSHPLANSEGYYQGSNVDLMIEIADAREAQRSYEANLKMFEQTRKMSSSLMDILRR